MRVLPLFAKHTVRTGGNLGDTATEAAFQSYLRSQGVARLSFGASEPGFDDQCQLIQTEHPYRAERHSWTKEVNMPNAKGIKLHAARGLFLMAGT